MNYMKLMGVDELAKSAFYGKGVKIAILDSGMTKRSNKASHEPMTDDFGHATEISSILTGGVGIIGMCGLADLSYYKVLDSNGTGSVKSVVKGIYRAIDDESDIINLSLGFLRTDKCPKALEKACEDACDAGKTIICAAGNDGGPVNWPAALKTTISVGSTDENGLKTSFSSVGEVDFVAPGVNLEVIGRNGSSKSVSGTSYSAAIVTGVSALLISHSRLGDLSVQGIDGVMAALKDLSQDIDDPGWDSRTGFGMISGLNQDRTVCMKMESGFFDRIFSKIKSIVCFNKKENKNGRIV